MEKMSNSSIPSLVTRQPENLQVLIRLCEQGQLKEAIHHLQQQNVIRMDTPTYAAILRACGNAKALHQGKLFHACLLRSGVGSSMFLQNLVLEMYGKCGVPENSWMVFETMVEQNIFSWTAIIVAYVEHGNGQKALDLFVQMQLGGFKIDKIVVLTIIKACSNPAFFAEGRLVHSLVLRYGFAIDDDLGAALVHMYNKCGKSGDIAQLFDTNIARKGVCMTKSDVHHGIPRKHMYQFQKIQEAGFKLNKVMFIGTLKACSSLHEGRMIHSSILHFTLDLDITVQTALTSMYAKCESLEEARMVFAKISPKGLVSWNTMLGICLKYSQHTESLQLFQDMQQQDIKPDAFTYSTILSACADIGAVGLGRSIQSCIEDQLLELNTIIANTLINMYGKCGSLEEASMVFMKMSRRGIQSWNSILAVHALQGHDREAFRLFQLMQKLGVKATHVTFIAILSSCSHGGMLDEGCHNLLSIRDHGLCQITEHYGCIVDLLGRVGWMDEAEDLIREMPFPYDVVVWRALMGACKVHKDLERGKHAAEQVFKLDPEEPSAHVFLLNAYRS